MKWLFGKGILQIDNGVRIVLKNDICHYYRWLIAKNFPWIRTQIPKYKAHITIYNPNIHGLKDTESIHYLQDKEVTFYYNPEMMYRSSVNFWLPVRSEIYNEVKYFLNFKETPNWWGLHLTVCNMKL